MRIEVKKFLYDNQATNKEQGLRICNLIFQKLKKSSEVIVDFEDMELITACFLNPIISKLYKDLPKVEAEKIMNDNFKNLSDTDRELIIKVQDTILNKRNENLKLIKELDLNPKSYFISRVEIVKDHSICFSVSGLDEYAGSYSITFYNDNVQIHMLKTGWNPHFQILAFWEKIDDRNNIIMFIEAIIENQKKELNNSINILKKYEF